VIDEEICGSCDRCEEICPPKALARKGKDLILDYGKCIRCFCCLEVCPEGAISIKQGWALRLASRKQKAEGGRQQAES
jgi:Fe-S-cluster-containing hydrogenase component 2